MKKKNYNKKRNLEAGLSLLQFIRQDPKLSHNKCSVKYTCTVSKKAQWSPQSSLDSHCFVLAWKKRGSNRSNLPEPTRAMAQSNPIFIEFLQKFRHQHILHSYNDFGSYLIFMMITVLRKDKKLSYNASNILQYLKKK